MALPQISRSPAIPKELGYVENSATAQTGITTITDVTGMSVTFTARSLPIVAVAWMAVNKVTNNGIVTGTIRDSSDVAQAVYSKQVTAATFDYISIWHRWAPGTLTAGTQYTMKLAVTSSNATVSTVVSATGPIKLHIFEVGA